MKSHIWGRLHLFKDNGFRKWKAGLNECLCTTWKTFKNKKSKWCLWTYLITFISLIFLNRPWIILQLFRAFESFFQTLLESAACISGIVLWVSKKETVLTSNRTAYLRTLTLLHKSYQKFIRPNRLIKLDQEGLGQCAVFKLIKCEYMLQ